MKKPIILATAMTAILSTSFAYAESLPGKGIKVNPVQSTISEETFQTLIVAKALEELGYDVAPIKEVDYNVAYASIANGDATFLAVSWVPLHNAQYEAAGGDKAFYRQGEYIINAAQGYLIDKKTAEKYNITNIEQFKDPKIAKLFDSNGNGKADLTGCNPGWGCEAAINTHLKAYDLEKSIDHNQGNYAAMMANTITRYKEGNPIFYYTWTPYWISDVLKPGRDVVWLEVPFSAMPEGVKTDTALPNGKNYGFPPSSMRIAANKQWAAENPAAAKLFATMKLPLADVNAQNLRMHNGESSQEDIERHANAWIKAHQATFDGWVEQAKQAAK